MGKAHHAAVVPLRGNERPESDQSKTTAHVVEMPSEEIYFWLRNIHRAFCGQHTRTQKSDCAASVDAHREADEYLLDIFHKVCKVDHTSSQNPAIIQPLRANCFAVGKSAGVASESARRWNDSLPGQVAKRQNRKN